MYISYFKCGLPIDPIKFSKFKTCLKENHRERRSLQIKFGDSSLKSHKFGSEKKQQLQQQQQLKPKTEVTEMSEKL